MSDRPSRAEAAAVCSALALFLILAALEARRLTYPVFDDIAYLDVGNQVHVMGGPFGLLKALFAGTFTESNRHPLYFAFLSLVARVDPAYHRDAQAVTIALGAVALLSCWWVARRHFGRTAAAAFVILLAGSRTFVSCGAHEGCEPLLVAIWAQAIGAILDGLEQPGALKPWLFAGLWSGLAYLSKGTGMFLPSSLALTFLVVERWQALKDKRAYVYAAGFLATASPLIVRNLRLFGTPFYNYNLDMLWIDRLPDFAESTAPQAATQLTHTFSAYVHHLTASALFHRVAVGTGETLFLLAEAMAPSGGVAGGPVHIAAVILGAVAAVIAFRQIHRTFTGFARTFLYIHAGWTYFFLFIFSVNGGNTRYMLPLAATILMPAFAQRVLQDPKWAQRTAIVFAAGVAAALLLPAPPLVAPGMAEARDFIVAHVKPGDVYAVDARTHLQPRWLTPQAHQVMVSASWQEQPVDAQTLLDWLREHHVKYVLLDGKSTSTLISQPRYLFYDRLPLDPDGSLPLTGFPGGLKPVYVDPNTPRRWIVLETPWAS